MLGGYPKVNVQMATLSYLIRYCHLQWDAPWVRDDVLRYEPRHGTLSFLCRSSKKHSFLEAATSIICAEVNVDKMESNESHSKRVYIRVGGMASQGIGRLIFESTCEMIR